MPLESDLTALPVNPSHLADVEDLRRRFSSAEPFPLLVLDDFLDARLATALTAEFPPIEEMPRSRDYVFGNKRELSSIADVGPASQTFNDAVTSPSFARFLSAVTGMTVFVDPAFHGGGFHQGGEGSYLDFHVDFNVHPLHPGWLRRLNILIYLTPGWAEEWGGHLLVKRAPEDEPVGIAPLFNRAIIMLSDDFTYHGYKPFSAPAGVTRRSVATYAYSGIAEGETKPRTTRWVPEEAGPLKRALARNYNGIVQVKNRLFGSGTAKNR
jgi:hypothetical protein